MYQWYIPIKARERWSMQAAETPIHLPGGWRPFLFYFIFLFHFSPFLACCLLQVIISFAPRNLAGWLAGVTSTRPLATYLDI